MFVTDAGCDVLWCECLRSGYATRSIIITVFYCHSLALLRCYCSREEAACDARSSLCKPRQSGTIEKEEVEGVHWRTRGWYDRR